MGAPLPPAPAPALRECCRRGTAAPPRTHPGVRYCGCALLGTAARAPQATPLRQSTPTSRAVSTLRGRARVEPCRVREKALRSQVMSEHGGGCAGYGVCGQRPRMDGWAGLAGCFALSQDADRENSSGAAEQCGLSAGCKVGGMREGLRKGRRTHSFFEKHLVEHVLGQKQAAPAASEEGVQAAHLADAGEPAAAHHGRARVCVCVVGS